MGPVEEVSFELERFEWTLDDRLEVVGRWNGVGGRRIGRPSLTVDAGGRRHRLSDSDRSGGEPGQPWRASFAWDGERGEIAGAELELGRSLVVELPPPRRRRRRRAATVGRGDLHAQVDELRAIVADLRAERAAAPSAEELASLRAGATDAGELRSEVEALRAGAVEAAEGDRDARLAEALAEGARLATELESLRTQAAGDEAGADAQQLMQELAGLRLAHGSLRASHEQLEDQLDATRAVRDERDELARRLDQVRAQAGDEEQQRNHLREVVRELEQRASAAAAARERLTVELAAAHEDVARLEGLLDESEESLAAARTEGQQRVESERATTTEVHSRLATAREEAQRTIVAEAEETERLREELTEARAESERLLAAARAEVARLREELVTAHADDAGEDGESTEASRRMLERVSRELERERATSRHLRRELDTLRSDTAGQRRVASSATANGTLSTDEPPAAATAAGRSPRAVRTPERSGDRRAAGGSGTQRHVEAARVAATQRVPKVSPSPVSLWAVRIVAALVVALLGVALVILVSMVT